MSPRRPIRDHWIATAASTPTGCAPKAWEITSGTSATTS